MSKPSRIRSSLSTRLGLLCVSLALSLALLELAARGLGGELRTTRNFLWRDAFMLGQASPAAHDPLLGWVPRAGSDTRYAGKRVSVDGRGLRSNGAVAGLDSQSEILAVGDSYTFGSQVGDAETWPALLQRRLDARVWNAGVFNYAVDQIVLRAEGLLEELEPDVVIASFIPSDILRAELRMRGHAHKPWFEFEGNTLALRGVPVPEPVGTRERLGLLRGTFGHSYALHRALLALAPSAWILGSGPDQRVHRDGAAVSCALLQRLADQTRARAAKLAILVQYGDARRRAERRPIALPVVECSEELAGEDVAVIDLYERLETLRRQRPRVHRRLFDGHMTPGGNAWVAEQLAEQLAVRGWAARRRD